MVICGGRHVPDDDDRRLLRSTEQLNQQKQGSEFPPVSTSALRTLARWGWERVGRPRRLRHVVTGWAASVLFLGWVDVRF